MCHTLLQKAQYATDDHKTEKTKQTSKQKTEKSVNVYNKNNRRQTISQRNNNKQTNQKKQKNLYQPLYQVMHMTLKKPKQINNRNSEEEREETRK